MKTYFGRGTIPPYQPGSSESMNLAPDTVCWFLHQDDHKRALRLLEQPDPDLDEEIANLKKEYTELCDTYDEMKRERNDWRNAAEGANDKAEKATEALIREEHKTTLSVVERLTVLKAYGLQCPACQGKGSTLEMDSRSQLDALLERIEKYHTLFPDIQADIARLREALS